MVKDSRRPWWVVLETAALSLLEKKPTGCVKLIINQGGIQNTKVSKEIKEQFRVVWRQHMSGFITTALLCHIAEGKLRTFCRK